MESYNMIKGKGVKVIKQKNLVEKLAENGYYLVEDENEVERRAKLMRFCCDDLDEVVMEIEPLNDIGVVVIVQDYKNAMFFKNHVYATYHEDEGESGRGSFCLNDDNGNTMRILLD